MSKFKITGRNKVIGANSSEGFSCLRYGSCLLGLYQSSAVSDVNSRISWL